MMAVWSDRVGDTQEQLTRLPAAQCLARLDEKRDLVNRQPERRDALQQARQSVRRPAVTSHEPKAGGEKEPGVRPQRLDLEDGREDRGGADAGEEKEIAR